MYKLFDQSLFIWISLLFRKLKSIWAYARSKKHEFLLRRLVILIKNLIVYKSDQRLHLHSWYIITSIIKALKNKNTNGQIFNIGSGIKN